MQDWSVRKPGDPKPPKGSTKGSPTAMQKHLDWPALEERRARTRVVVMYKILHGLVDIPINILVSNMRDTRIHKQKYCVMPATIKAYKYSFFPVAVDLWNHLLTAVVNAPSVDAMRAWLSATTLLKPALY